MEAKWCFKCGETHDVEEFNWKNKLKGLRQSSCRKQTREASATHYQATPGPYKARARAAQKKRRIDFRQYVWDFLKSHPCPCGEAEPLVLEFHHVRGDKVAAVSTLMSQATSLGVLQAEIDKCDVLCVRCHRLLTMETHGWYRDLIQPDPTAEI